MNHITAVTVSVEYGDLLGLVAPHNAHQFDRWIVVTSPADVATHEVCREFQNIECLHTTAFWDRGARFNKGAGLNLGLERARQLSPAGWIVLLDADVVLPPNAGLRNLDLQPGTLYCPVRRMLDDPRDLNPALDWSTIPARPREEFAGFMQVFHTRDPHLPATGPWYPADWWHAGGADSFFWKQWPQPARARLPFEVLHLGPDGQNWCGRVTPFLDGTIPPDSEARREILDAMLRRRDEARGADRFRHEKLEPGS